MTTLKIYYSRLLCAAILVIFASAAAGHSVHSDSHSHDQGKAQTQTLPKRNIDELIQQYSLVGDDSLLIEARELLPAQSATWSVQQLLQATWLAQAEHKFAQARVYLQVVFERQPNNGQAWLLESAISKVMGDHRAARRACGYVVSSVSADAAVICFATLADTAQERAAALLRLRQLPAVRSGSNQTDSNLSAWRLSVQAELARDIGDMTEAKTLLRRAIAISPAVQTRVVLMDILLAQARFDEALALSAEGEPVPALAIRRLLAQRGLGQDVSASVALLDKRFRSWLAEEDFRHAREMAIFYLDVEPQVHLAYLVAKKNARLQREPEDLALLRRAAKLQRTLRES